LCATNKGIPPYRDRYPQYHPHQSTAGAGYHTRRYGSARDESDRLYRFAVTGKPDLNRMHTDIGGKTHNDPEYAKMPQTDIPLFETLSYHVRSGGHDITSYDWQQCG